MSEGDEQDSKLDPRVRAGCRLILDLAPVWDEDDELDLPRYEATVRVTRLPALDTREAEEWDFRPGFVKADTPDQALAAAAAIASAWADKANEVDASEELREKRAAEREARKAS